MADPTPGGTWSSNNLPIAGINSSTGLVTGVSAGTANITYTITSSTCYNTTVVTVNPNPSPIGGVTAICAGSTTTLADATTGGSWSSSNTTIATIDPVTGFLTGVLSGTVTITNIFSTGCKATMPFQVNPLPAPITGVTYVCQGATTILHDLTTGGTWSSDNISVATVSAGPDVVVLAGGHIQIKATATGSNLLYLWSPSAGLNRTDVLQPVASPTVNTKYMLTVISTNGGVSCPVTSTVTVSVLQAPVIPTSFTPNGDGINDTWIIQNLDTYPGATVDVYNRNGGKVFSSVGYSIPWDGRYNGANLPEGTYYYIIDPKNGRTKISGYVAIIR